LCGHLREAASSLVETLREKMSGDSDEAVRDASRDALTRLGYYNPLTGKSKQRGFFRDLRARARSAKLGPDGRPMARAPMSSLSRRTRCEVGATVRVWWPDDECFYEARIRAWDRERDVHTLVYVLDGVQEDLDLKKERCELRYKPHKRGAN
jgi:hypothetical protein